VSEVPNVSNGSVSSRIVPSGYDVREVANFVLDVADENGERMTNLSLNKILYFLHSAFLHQFRRPLVSAKIEAWDHGPVFREVYHQFKKYGRQPITDRAHRVNPHTGGYEIAAPSFTAEEVQFLRSHAHELLKISPGKLVDMSHVKDGPWHMARFNNGTINPGVEITNDAILSDTEPRH
jgi:uncharacterized phage-associated protein